jgi:hypothetical protein
MAAVRFISTDSSELGIIGVGQFAHGFFAFGQVACGVVAVGQAAVGVLAIGQASFSICGAGMVGGGVAWFGGMLGIGGRGVCIRLIPGLDVPRTLPETVPFHAVWQGATRGLVRVGVSATPTGIALTADGHVLPVKFRPHVLWALDNAVRTHGMREVYASLRREGESIVCDRLVEVPGQRKGGIPLWLNVLRFVMLVGLATGWWYAFSEAVLRG